ncbi:MAG TPA: hypothetical protein VKB79_26855 [Bryobacteraceae bacterium]|nr:hypothetical protein [Bryobacteraceae bacterium]
MGMERKGGKGSKPAAAGDSVTVTMGTTEAQNLLLALTEALGAGDDKKKKKKKKKKDVPPPPFGK